MASFARIIGLAFFMSLLGGAVGLLIFGGSFYSEYIVLVILLGSVGAILGVIAGAGVEIASALRHKENDRE